MIIAIIVGTRPQIIKAWPLRTAFRKRGHKVVIINSGQHYDYSMSKNFFKEFRFKTDIFARNLIKVDYKPFDAVIHIGDTDTALYGALGALKDGVKTYHVEAGCRSGRWIKEEWNRVLIDKLSNVCFAATQNCMNNLKKEGMERKSHITGDVLYDAWLKDRYKPQNVELPFDAYVFLTLHRRENQTESKILDAIWKARVLGRVEFPVHPHTRKHFRSINIPGVTFLDPLPYFTTRSYIKCAECVVTDSGGIQREACFAGKPCLLLREETEWPEAVAGDVEAFGDGHAAEKIADLITS